MRYLKATEESFSKLDGMIQKFPKVSGLKLNYDKSVVVPLGRKVGPVCAANGYNWPNGQLYYLGVMLSTQAEFIPDLNLDAKITQLEEACTPYRHRIILPWGGQLLFILCYHQSWCTPFKQLHLLMLILGTLLLGL